MSWAFPSSALDPGGSQHGQAVWPSWREPLTLLRHGAVTVLGMIYWHAPGAGLAALGWSKDCRVLIAIGVLLFLCGTVAVPGYMTHYCRDFSVREVFSPWLAIRRIRHAGIAYWRTWDITAAALVLSFLRVLGFGVVFFVTSVWFWQVAGFSFASVFTHVYRLSDEPSVGGLSPLRSFNTPEFAGRLK